MGSTARQSDSRTVHNWILFVVLLSPILPALLCDATRSGKPGMREVVRVVYGQGRLNAIYLANRK
jgi:hypothetical protein